jgi:hypothetical protein
MRITIKEDHVTKLSDVFADCERFGVEFGPKTNAIKNAAGLGDVREELQDLWEWAHVTDLGAVWRVLFYAVEDKLKSLAKEIT